LIEEFQLSESLGGVFAFVLDQTGSDGVDADAEAADFAG
jgi:hypothetical protein